MSSSVTPALVRIAPPLLAATIALTTMPARADTAAAPPPATRQAAFTQCLACHTIETGRNGFGPSLAGVAGRKAASVPGYAYSDALKKSGLTWDAATLDRWLTSPQKLVPGTRMPFMGIADAARRQEVVTYLLTLE